MYKNLALLVYVYVAVFHFCFRFLSTAVSVFDDVDRRLWRRITERNNDFVNADHLSRPCSPTL